MRKFNGNRLKNMRESKGYSLNGLARLIKLRCGKNLTKQAIQQWECGNATPKIESLICICELFDLPMDIFFSPRSNYLFVRRTWDGFNEMIEQFTNQEFGKAELSELENELSRPILTDPIRIKPKTDPTRAREN